jgi:predicted Na+-dependent transporter
LPQWVEKTRHHYRPINLALLFLLFFAALGPYNQEILGHLLDLRLWLALVVTHTLLYGLAKLGTWHIRNPKEVVAIESNLLFLNTGLGIVIAENYFGPNEVLFMVFVQIAWMLLLAGFKYLK